MFLNTLYVCPFIVTTIIAKSQFESLTFYQMTFREISRLNSTTLSKDLLESLKFLINSKSYLNINKINIFFDITWISCDSLHVWLQTQSQFTGMVSSLIARR